MADKSVDIVYLFNVLEHIKHDGDVVKAIAKKLKKGGKLLIYVPAFNHLFSSMDKKVGHFRRYTRQMLGDAIKNADLKVVTNRYHDPLGYFAALAYKAVGNDRGDLDPKKIVFFDKFIFPLNKYLEPLTRYWFGKNVFVVAEATKK